MAIKNIIARGIGFSPGNSDWIITAGFGLLGAPSMPGLEYTLPQNRTQYTLRDNKQQYTLATNRLQYTPRN